MYLAGGGFASSGGDWGLRPAVSLKPTMEVFSGSGLKTDPYIIE